MLNREYEMFSMKEGESIDELFERFNIIVNGLDAMGITYSESVLVRRILRSLTKEKMVKLKERSKESSSRKQKKDFSKVICYNCKETGHFKFDCPKLKKEEKPKKGKKKRMMASWEDLENDSEEDEE
nr:zinc finger CCHC-type and RNA-binding motif-containing protein 1-like [Arachis hypogaea]